jgi:hypothetical protein
MMVGGGGGLGKRIHCNACSPCSRDTPCGTRGTASTQIEGRFTPDTIALLDPRPGQQIQHLLGQSRTIPQVVRKLFPDRFHPIPLAHLFPSFDTTRCRSLPEAHPLPAMNRRRSECGVGSRSASDPCPHLMSCKRARYRSIRLPRRWRPQATPPGKIHCAQHVDSICRTCPLGLTFAVHGD